MSFLWRAQLVLIAPIAVYALFLLALTVPSLQRVAIFANIINFPPVSQLQDPTSYGFGAGQLRHLNISVRPDGVHLGGWHVLPEEAYEAYTEQYGYGSIPPDSYFDDALKDTPTLLYAHGNAGNRGTGHRRRLARHISAADLNFVIFDYRGYGDSSMHVPPTEDGLVQDARAVWNWLTQDKGVPASQIGLAGQSLGTGVMSKLAGRSLRDQGITPRALILIAPFSSMPKLLETYRFFQLIPILGPLVRIPGAHKLLTSFLLTHFDTRSHIQRVASPIVLLHARDDRHIMHSHSATLFDELASQQTESVKKQDLGETVGIIRSAGRIKHVELAHGGHNAVGYSEGALHYIREVMR